MWVSTNYGKSWSEKNLLSRCLDYHSYNNDNIIILLIFYNYLFQSEVKCHYEKLSQSTDLPVKKWDLNIPR